ncbi:hypothetical protein TWF481_004356 [Arthrobotrys musiformis]|uniref:Uncharacterized protein n=1 Tax=Arthrobotrys musiformis TaxID=47236 RepID=A0AAV9WKH6_9PEZI
MAGVSWRNPRDRVRGWLVQLSKSPPKKRDPIELMASSTPTEFLEGMQNVRHQSELCSRLVAIVVGESKASGLQRGSLFLCNEGEHRGFPRDSLVLRVPPPI